MTETTLGEDFKQKIVQPADLTSALQRANISTENWGVNKAKSVEELQAEMEAGETVLIEREGRLLRLVNVAQVDVFYQDSKGKQWRLYEDRQELNDGKGTIRRRQMFGVSEKFKPGEDPLDVAKRGIQEELQITDLPNLNQVNTDTYEEPSFSYPGLPSEYHMHYFAWRIPDSEFKPEGYKEEQKKKTVYFEWRPIDWKPSNESTS